MTSPKTIALPILVLLLASTAVAWPILDHGASSVPSGDKSGTNWLKWYTEACDTLLTAAQDCSLCHVTVEQLNPYGEDLFLVDNEPWRIEDLDSDGDGIPNGEEVANCTGPGWFDPPLAAPVETWGALKLRWR